jgi:hypothetical protein
VAVTLKLKVNLCPCLLQLFFTGLAPDGSPVGEAAVVGAAPFNEPWRSALGEE